MNARSPRTARRHAGFTLIELMIAMILGLIVIAGVTSVFLAGQRSYRTNNALSEVESGSRIAFDLMARDIREAGLTGCGASASGRVVNVLNTQTTNWWANWNNQLHGYGGVGLTGDPSDGDADQTDPAVTTGTAAGNRLAGTDSLQVMGADGMPVTILSDAEPAGTFTLHDATSAFGSGDLAIVCSPDHGAIFQLGTYASGGPTVTHTAGGTQVPGNTTLNLGYPNGVYTFPINSEIAKLGVSDWYVGTNGAGGTSLYRVALANTAGNIAVTAQEMVRNVTDMQITYLQGTGPTFIPAASVTNWGAVKAVHVTLTLASNFQRASANGNKPITRTYSATTTVRNRVN